MELQKAGDILILIKAVLLLFLVGTVFGISKVVGVCKSWSNTVNFKTTLASVSQTLQKDSGMKMSSSTASKGKSLSNAVNNLSQAKSNLDNSNILTRWFAQYKYNKALANVSQAKDSYEAAKSGDSIYQKSLSLANGNSFDISKFIIPACIVGVIVLIVLLFLKFKASKHNSVRVSSQSSTISESDAIVDQEMSNSVRTQGNGYSHTFTPKDVDVGPDLVVNYERLLYKNCDRLGLNYNQTLEKYGTARAAVEATNMMF